MLGVVTARYPRVVRVGLILDTVAELPLSVTSLSPSDVEVITQVEAGALDDGKWPVVGFIEDFIAAQWPNPPMLPGDRADKAQAPGDLARGMVKAVERVRRRRLQATSDSGLIPVSQDEGRRYAELVLGRGSLLARMVRDSLDLNEGSFAATLAFIEIGGEWQTGEFDRENTATEDGWVRANEYVKALVPTLRRFLAAPSHTVVFDYERLDLSSDLTRRVWQRIETEPNGPLQIIPVQIFFRDEASKREMYAALGGNNVDEAATEAAIGFTFDPVIHIALMLDVDIDKFPPHAHPIDAQGLAELARHVRGFALRWTSYDGYLIWLTDQ